MSATESIMLLHERVNRLEGMSWFGGGEKVEYATKNDYTFLLKQIEDVRTALESSMEIIRGQIEYVGTHSDERCSQVEDESKTQCSEAVASIENTKNVLEQQMASIQEENRDFYQQVAVVDMKQNSDIYKLNGYSPMYGKSAEQYIPSGVPVQYQHSQTFYGNPSAPLPMGCSLISLPARRY